MSCKSAWMESDYSEKRGVRKKSAPGPMLGKDDKGAVGSAEERVLLRKGGGAGPRYVLGK